MCARTAGADALIHYIELALNWLTAHVLTVIYPGTRSSVAAASTATPPPLNPQAGQQPPLSNPQAGHATPGLLLLVALGMVSVLSACSLLPQKISQVEEGAAQSVVQSSERTICRDIPIGTWMRLYGTSPDRIKGWQALCFNPVTTALNDATVAAIQKVYPAFERAVASGAALPAPVTVPPTQPDASATK